MSINPIGSKLFSAQNSAKELADYLLLAAYNDAPDLDKYRMDEARARLAEINAIFAEIDATAEPQREVSNAAQARKAGAA